MTYSESARDRWGMFYAYWRHGWDARQNGENPTIPRHYSYYAEKAYMDGYKEAGDIVKSNWHALGVAT